MQQLKLNGMIESYDEVISDSIKRKAPISYVLCELLKSEAKTRTLKAIRNRMNMAKFPEAKDLHNFIFSNTPINSEQVMNLYSCDFVKTSRNIILIGGSGTGKSHLAIAIASKAVRKEYKVRFFNLVDLETWFNLLLQRLFPVWYCVRYVTEMPIEKLAEINPKSFLSHRWLSINDACRFIPD